MYINDPKKWSAHFRSLQSYHKKHGNTDLPHEHKARRWLVSNQEKWEQLDPKRLSALYGLGVRFGYNNDLFVKNIASLYEYFCEYGHCNVTTAQDKKLGQWLSSQRRRKEHLPASRVKLLEGLKVNWDPMGDKWETNYEELRTFREKHGHCRVPSERPDALYQWTMKLRRRKNRLPKDQIKALNALGFCWDRADDANWNLMFREAKSYFLQIAKGNRPKMSRKLTIWLSYQREKFRNKTLEPEYVEQLDSIGMNWTIENSFNRHIEDLREFITTNGHAQIPVHYSENPRLGRWLSHIRCGSIQLNRRQKSELRKLGVELKPRRRNKRRAARQRT